MPGSWGVPRRSARFGAWLLPAALAGGVASLSSAQTSLPTTLGQPPAAAPGPDDTLLPLNLPPLGETAPGGAATSEAAKSEHGASEAEIASLKDALQEMNTQNPVVARVNGYNIRWADVVASAGDLPPRYRDQIETVFPALLDRLVDLRLLAEAARREGLRDDPQVQQRLVSYEDRVLSSVLLERYLAEQVTTAALRKRYDAIVASRRADQEIRARHILFESRAEAEAAIAQLRAGAVFITLATELSKGASAARGGDLGYFHPSRMPPAFGKAALALEPGEYTAEPVETEFGWHVILLVDRRADNIASFLDMQDSLHSAATKEAVDHLVLSLRQQAYLEMFPEDAVAAGPADAAPAKVEGAK